MIKKLFSFFKKCAHSDKQEHNQYRIVAVDDSYQNTGKVCVKVQLIGSSKMKICSYLKRKDNIDYYDFKTKFNPFSLALD